MTSRLPIYQAADTGQMREASDTTTASSLEIHELRDDGLPLCGRKPDSWQGKAMVLVPLGREGVTCMSCARITGH